MKFMVVGCPSLRMGKLRLYDVTMVFATADRLLRAAPLPNAGAAGIGQNGRVDRP